jgi:2-deoxy-D-gluconate 3-dehydrogenase
MKLNNLFSIEDKVALVTGGSRGIGEMIAAGFLANGAKVYISSRKVDVCNATAARLREEFGGECISIPANLAEIDGIEACVSEIEKHEDRLDILVNNAGVSWGAPLGEFPGMGWDKVMDTNVKGVFFLTQRVLPLLEAAIQPARSDRDGGRCGGTRHISQFPRIRIHRG